MHTHNHQNKGGKDGLAPHSDTFSFTGSEDRVDILVPAGKKARWAGDTRECMLSRV